MLKSNDVTGTPYFGGFSCAVTISQSKVVLLADQRSDEQLPEGLAGAPRELPNLRLCLMVFFSPS